MVTFMKKITGFIAMVLMLIMLTACGSSSLVGKWERTEGGFWSSIDFSSDGTYKTSGIFSGDYTTEGDKLKLTIKVSGFGDRVYNYKVTNDILILDNDEDGEHAEFLRVE